MRLWLGRIGAVLLWLVVAACLTLTVVPRFLDRIYYRGPASGHFDGARFFNPDGDDDRLKVPGGGTRWGFLLRQATGSDGRPAWPDSVPVTPSKPGPSPEAGGMIVTWIGHATLLIQADGYNILTDPIWSDTAGPLGFGPRRVAEPGVRFEDLPKIDLVLISHNHYDHMDLPTLKRLWDRDRPAIVTALGNDAILRAAGIEARALDWGQHVYLGHGQLTDEVPNFECGAVFGAGETENRCGFPEIVATRNHHWDSRWFADRNRALWTSFVVKLPHGNIFFAGDTGIGDGKWPAEAAALGPIRFAAIPIGAFRFESGQMASGSHIGPRDAVRVWGGLGRPFAIPIHWGTFRLSWEAYRTPPDMLRGMMACAGADPARFGAVRIGEPVRIPPLGAAPPPPDFARLAACEKRGDFSALR